MEEEAMAAELRGKNQTMTIQYASHTKQLMPMLHAHASRLTLHVASHLSPASASSAPPLLLAPAPAPATAQTGGPAASRTGPAERQPGGTI